MCDIECKINLIMFNPHQGTPFTASSMEQVEAFRDIVKQVVIFGQQPLNTHILNLVAKEQGLTTDNNGKLRRSRPGLDASLPELPRLLCISFLHVIHYKAVLWS